MNSEQGILLSSDLLVHLDKRQVYKDKTWLKLPDLSYQVMLVLIKAYPEPVSINRLIDEVWEAVEVSPETVTQRIAMLRKVLSSADEGNDKYIMSVRNKGYRWAAAVKAKNTNFSTQRKPIFLGMAILMLIPLYYLVDHQPVNNQVTTTAINSQVSADEFTQQAWRYLGKHDAKNNRLAVEMFEESLQIQADNLDGLVGLSVALSHEVSKFNQPHELLFKAISLADKATKLYASEAKTWGALAFAHDVNGAIDTAMSYYEKSLDLNPHNTSVQGAVAYLYGIKGELIESLKMNLQLLDSDQEYTNLQVAQNLHLLGFIELADQWYRRADVLSPNNVFASNLRVRFLLSNQRYQEAQVLLGQAIKRGVNRPETHTLQGILQLIQGESLSALNSFEQALSIKGEDVEARLWRFIASGKPAAEMAVLEGFGLYEESQWSTDVINRVVLYAAMGQREKMLAGLEDAFNKGYMDSQWLLQLPPLKPYLSDPEFLFWLDKMQQKADSQRQELLTVDWLPTGFLDPAYSSQ